MKNTFGIESLKPNCIQTIGKNFLKDFDPFIAMGKQNEPGLKKLKRPQLCCVKSYLTTPSVGRKIVKKSMLAIKHGLFFTSKLFWE